MWKQHPLVFWLNGPAHHRTGVRFFQAMIGVALLFRFATEVPFAGWLWGARGLPGGGAFPALGPWSQAVEGLYADDRLIVGLLLLQAVGALLLITGQATRFAASLCLFAVTMLEWRTMEINDGGDNLARICLCYFLFLAPPNRVVAPGSLRAYLHNLGVLLLIAQVMILYFVAGLAKAMGEVWMNGTALYLISQVEEFSLPGLRALFKNPFLTVGASYLTLGLQLFFPISFFTRFKLFFLLLGMAFHLGIAGFMGLVSFSLIMAGADLLLISDEEYGGFRRWLPAWPWRWPFAIKDTPALQRGAGQDL
ncbi:MAG: hypothetical protein IPG45_02010 [Deltaproteobacteria bacterium]|nr:hypothetical protein [Deltaproteobacteria bacterium]